MLLFQRAVTVASQAERLGVGIAPHVAGEIAQLGALPAADIEFVLHALSPSQLAGMSVLPGRVPIPERSRTQFEESIRRVSPAGRRLLLTAAFSTTDRSNVVLAAAAVDPTVAFTEDLERLMTWENGRYGFRSESMRTMVIQDARQEAMPVHQALAHAHRQRGELGRAAWHVMQRRAGVSEAATRTLLAFGENLLSAGSVYGAYRVGRLLERRTSGAVATAGALLAGRAALAFGCLEEAADLLEPLAGTAAKSPAGPAAAAARGLLSGALPGERFSPLVDRQLPLIESSATTRSDHEAVAAIERLVRAWDGADGDDVDAIHSRLMLSMIPSRRPWPWETSTGAVSPLVDACVQGQQVGLLLLTGDLEATAVALRECLIRLPMTHLAGGGVAGVLPLLRYVDPALWEGLSGALARVHPIHPVDVQPASVMDGPRATAIARHGREQGERSTATWALTCRETEIVELVAHGLTSKVIGERLGIVARTVDNHLGHIFQKTGARTRGELIASVLRDR